MPLESPANLQGKRIAINEPDIRTREEKQIAKVIFEETANSLLILHYNSPERVVISHTITPAGNVIHQTNAKSVVNGSIK